MDQAAVGQRCGITADLRFLPLWIRHPVGWRRSEPSDRSGGIDSGQGLIDSEYESRANPRGKGRSRPRGVRSVVGGEVGSALRCPSGRGHSGNESAATFRAVPQAGTLHVLTLPSLRQSEPPSYRELLQRVHGAYLAQGRLSPTPVPEGTELDRGVLGGEPTPLSFQLVKDGRGRWLVQAGQLHGCTEGSILAVR